MRESVSLGLASQFWPSAAGAEPAGPSGGCKTLRSRRRRKPESSPPISSRRDGSDASESGESRNTPDAGLMQTCARQPIEECQNGKWACFENKRAARLTQDRHLSPLPFRVVVQLGRTRGSGPRGQGFESLRPDQYAFLAQR